MEFNNYGETSGVGWISSWLRVLVNNVQLRNSERLYRGWFCICTYNLYSMYANRSILLYVRPASFAIIMHRSPSKSSCKPLVGKGAVNFERSPVDGNSKIETKISHQTIFLKRDTSIQTIELHVFGKFWETNYLSLSVRNMDQVHINKLSIWVILYSYYTIYLMVSIITQSHNYRKV